MKSHDGKGVKIIDVGPLLLPPEEASRGGPPKPQGKEHEQFMARMHYKKNGAKDIAK